MLPHTNKGGKKMKNLPIGIQAFSDIRTNPNNYLYVDKTQYIYQMATTGKVYFLSRPRRFGKSLLLSAIENLFKGEKEMFEGLFIYDKWDWGKKSPVIKLDFGSFSTDSSEALRKSFAFFLKRQAENFEINLEASEIALPKAFEDLITKLAAKSSSKVVVLIDEYDMAILDNISNPEIREANRRILHDFYRVLKAKDEFLRFVFITGVSKFAGVSVFSGLNNIKDITFHEKYNSVCGYTQAELENNFPEHIAASAQELQISKQDLLDKIKHFYNGYSWNGKETVYNPFSTLKLFDYGEFQDFWFESGSPTFLIKLLKKRNHIEKLLDDQNVSPSIFKSYDPDNIDEVSLLFQTGYLTVKKIVKADDDIEYVLGIPNTEVRKALVECLFSAYAELSFDAIFRLRKEMKKQILDCDGAGFERNLTMIYSRIPKRLHIAREAYYHSLFLLAMQFLDFRTYGELSTDKGILDLALEGGDWVAIAELKYSGRKSAKVLIKEAMKQIEDKKYYQPYLNKKVILIAAAYTPKEIKCEMKTLKL
jgi:hypothetical protein